MILLRPRQEQFVERSLAALEEHGNTLAVAMTGFGKTIALSSVIAKSLDKSGQACVLAHRDELTQQNKATFERYVENDLNRLTTSVVNAEEKSWKGNVVYSMVQTLSREKQLNGMPPVDMLVIDEAHHAAAPTYRKVIDKAKARNPNVKIYGVTASPSRSDGKGLRPIFSNVADHVRLGEIIRAGNLVPPKTFVIDVGVQEQLKGVKKKADDFDMQHVASIMDHSVINEEVVKHWKEKASDRKTIVFCSTVAHANHVCEAFTDENIKAAVIHGEMSSKERKAMIRDFDQGDLQVLLNCFVLTEGFDSQPVGCVILLRPSSHKSTFTQMVGRGLRTVDPNRYPGVVKKDCIILDFGTSAIVHGSLEHDIELDDTEIPEERKPKTCPECDTIVPPNCRECPICGHEWERQGVESKDPLLEFSLSEIDLLNHSRFRWVDPFGDEDALMATGFNAWVGAFFYFGTWYSLGRVEGSPIKLLAAGEKTVCIAAGDDYLNTHESHSGAIKSKNWLNLPATEKQLKNLPTKYRMNFGLDRYHASCLLSFRFNRGGIKRVILNAANQHKDKVQQQTQASALA